MTIDKQSGRHQRSLPEPLRALAEGDSAAQHASVNYESFGCLLVIGASTRIAGILESLGPQLRPIVLLTDSKNVASLPQGLTCLQGQLLELSGYLGQFHVAIQGKKNPLNLGLLCPNNKPSIDLILDLSSPPYLTMEVPPLGYYAPGNDPEALKHALLELHTLVGTFSKPKFFRYDLAKCVHGRKGIQGCTRCIQACPTQAIASLQDRVQVDPHLCQGCATCAAVCPTGAIGDSQLQYTELLESLQIRIRSHTTNQRRRPVVLFHDSANHHTLIDTLRYELPSHFITVALRELAVAGMETWLNTLACGAAGIVLLATKRLPAITRRALQVQLQAVIKLLDGLGYSHKRVRILDVRDAMLGPDILHVDCPDPVIDTASFHAFNDKRRIVVKALTHLWYQAEAPRSSITLDVGAPFGEICVDPNLCTLCMSCTTVCPTRALQRGGHQAEERLEFIEAYCVQCAICAEACPEKAIELVPRYHYDQKQREQYRVLHEEPAFPCISCGKPFSTKSTVERMTEILRDNPFFQGEALNKLKQCPDCRSRKNIIDRLTPPARSSKNQIIPD